MLYTDDWDALDKAREARIVQSSVEDLRRMYEKFLNRPKDDHGLSYADWVLRNGRSNQISDAEAVQGD